MLAIFSLLVDCWNIVLSQSTITLLRLEHCFSEKFWKKIMVFSFLLKRSFHEIFICLEILDGSALIYVVTVKKVSDLFLTLLQVIAIPAYI